MSDLLFSVASLPRESRSNKGGGLAQPPPLPKVRG
jgi:hypothetical protein